MNLLLSAQQASQADVPATKSGYSKSDIMFEAACSVGKQTKYMKGRNMFKTMGLDICMNWCRPWGGISYMYS